MKWSMFLFPQAPLNVYRYSPFISSYDGLILCFFPSFLTVSPCLFPTLQSIYLSIFIFFLLSSLLIFFYLVLNLTLDSITHCQTYEEKKQNTLVLLLCLSFFMDTFTKIGYSGEQQTVLVNIFSDLLLYSL